jgi:hypothetical protein
MKANGYGNSFQVIRGLKVFVTEYSIKSILKTVIDNLVHHKLNNINIVSIIRTLN